LLRLSVFFFSSFSFLATVLVLLLCFVISLYPTLVCSFAYNSFFYLSYFSTYLSHLSYPFIYLTLLLILLFYLSYSSTYLTLLLILLFYLSYSSTYLTFFCSTLSLVLLTLKHLLHLFITSPLPLFIPSFACFIPPCLLCLLSYIL
jgi:hypothetical protein